MSKLNRKIARARRFGVYVYREGVGYDIFVMSEHILGPRDLKWSKRRAANLAHQITIAKKQKLTVEFC